LLKFEEITEGITEESSGKIKNLALDYQIMKEKISRKNKEIVELRKAVIYINFKEKIH